MNTHTVDDVTAKFIEQFVEKKLNELPQANPVERVQIFFVGMSIFIIGLLVLAVRQGISPVSFIFIVAAIVLVAASKIKAYPVAGADQDEECRQARERIRAFSSEEVNIMKRLINAVASGSKQEIEEELAKAKMSSRLADWGFLKKLEENSQSGVRPANVYADPRQGALL